MNGTLPHSAEAKQKFTQLSTWACCLRVHSRVSGWDLCPTRLCEMGCCPVEEPQSVPLCIAELVGKGTRWCVLPRLQDADGPDMSVAQ